MLAIVNSGLLVSRCILLYVSFNIFFILLTKKNQGYGLQILEVEGHLQRRCFPKSFRMTIQELLAEFTIQGINLGSLYKDEQCCAIVKGSLRHAFHLQQNFSWPSVQDGIYLWFQETHSVYRSLLKSSLQRIFVRVVGFCVQIYTV